MEQPSFQWPPLESNPEVFTDYMHAVGLPQDWIIYQCFGLDDDCLSFVPQPAVAVIATFETLKKEGQDLGDPLTPAEFYMKQTQKLDCACGVIACIHSVLNNQDKIQITPDSILDKFFKSVKSQTPDERALSLENYTEFQTVHATYAAQGQSEQCSSEDQVNHHFIAFVLNDKGQIIELDGMKHGPVVAQEKSEDLLKDAAKILLKRVENGVYSESLAVLTLSKKPEDE